MTDSDKIDESHGEKLLRHLASLQGKRIFTISDAKKAALLAHIPANQVNKILSKTQKWT